MITRLSKDESYALLRGSRLARLGCIADGGPYVVPMNFAFDSQCLSFFTTEGTKTEFIAANRQVCFQVEEVTDPLHWRSVMLTGVAERVTKPEETERAMRLITERNPTLTPAINQTKIGAWTRLNRIAVYRVRPDAIYGRKTA